MIIHPAGFLIKNPALGKSLNPLSLQVIPVEIQSVLLIEEDEF